MKKNKKLVEENIDLTKESPGSLKRVTKFGWRFVIGCAVVIAVCLGSILAWYNYNSAATEERINTEVQHIVMFINDWYSAVGGESLPDVWKNNVDVRCNGRTCSLTSTGTELRAEYPDGSAKPCKLEFTTLFFDDTVSGGSSVICLITKRDGSVFKYTLRYREK